MEFKRLIPLFSEDDCLRLLMLSHGVISSLWGASNYNQILAEIYEKEEFKDLIPNFEEDLKIAIEVILRGLIHRRENL